MEVSKSCELPAPGELYYRDFRDREVELERFERRKRTAGDEGAKISVVQWNIERGYELKAIIQELKGLDADIICLQEVDMYCTRSQKVDIGSEIARELRMNYVFVCEFEEIHHEVRKLRDQGGGVHGNAILSRFDFKNARSFPHYEAYKWEQDGHKVQEPRKGRRYILAADIETPLGLVVTYCLHLEVFCGILDRIRQMADCFEDVRKVESQYLERGEEPPPILICGDLNTMAHSIARLSPKYCRDSLRFLSFGMNEATWWKRNLFDVTESKLLQQRQHRAYGKEQPIVNQRLLRWGLSYDEARRAINPGFYDPFNIYHDVTLRNHRGLFQGKLDWVLLKHLIAVSKSIGNHDYRASDHKWLRVELVIDRDPSKQQWLDGGLLELWTLFFFIIIFFLLAYWVSFTFF